ncbi:tetratricopeptide repeat-containing sensor histidine kinase [Sabulibacter ruber]|uniref:tetratricopeptide repeat-containing sensor histidine kinase n=1 Tax=Sabulibacter ruber TaxID=2811901 RepID=UPI001A96E080|nr:sensor histidine kinase [Sabulibacter ruber]
MQINIFRLLCAFFLWLAGTLQAQAQMQLLAEKTLKRQVNSLIVAGDRHLLNDNLDSARYYFLQAEALSRKNNFKYGLVLFTSYYIHVLNREGKYDEALKLNLRSIELCKEMKDSASLAIAYNNAGHEYGRKGALDSCATYYLKAIHIAEAIDSLTFVRRYTNNLAFVFLELGDAKKGLHYATLSHKLSVQLQDSFGVASSLVNIASAEKHLKQYEKSIQHNLQVIAYGKALKDPSYELDAYLILGEVAIDQKNYNSASAYFRKGAQILKTYSDPDYAFRFDWGMARVHFLLGSPQLANTYLEKGLKLAQSIGARAELRQMYHLGAEIKEELRQPYQALDFRKKYEALNDSLQSAEHKRNIHKMEMEYQTSQKEKAIAQQQLTIANTSLELQKKNNLIYLSVFALVVLLFLIVLLYQFYRNRQKAAAEKLLALQQVQEIEVLQALMQGEEKERTRIAKDLHDGVAGMLAAVKMHVGSLSLQDERVLQNIGYQQAVTLLDEASYEVRKTAHNLMPEMLMQHGLDEALRRYCLNISNEKTLVVQYDSWGEIKRYKDSFELSVYRIVQELINNIIKHSKADKAIVQLSYQHNVLSGTVEDNGIGFSHQEKGDGLGLSSLKSRVKAINGTLEVEAEVGSGVSAYLEFETSGLEVEAYELS